MADTDELVSSAFAFLREVMASQKLSAADMAWRVGWDDGERRFTDWLEAPEDAKLADYLSFLEVATSHSVIEKLGGETRLEVDGREILDGFLQQTPYQDRDLETPHPLTGRPAATGPSPGEPLAADTSPRAGDVREMDGTAVDERAHVFRFFDTIVAGFIIATGAGRLPKRLFERLLSFYQDRLSKSIREDQ